MRILVWARRIAFTGSAALLALALVAPVIVEAQEDPDAGRPQSWGAAAYTTGIEAFFNTPSAVEEVLRVSVPHGDSEFAAGGRSIARSASVWPGLLVAKGANLLCVAGFPCEQFAGLPTGFPPEWPFAAEAQFPTDVEVEAPASRDSVDAGPLTFTGHVVEARAGRDFVSTRALVTDVDFLPLAGGDTATSLPGGFANAGALQDASPSLLHVGALESVTLHQFDGDVLVAYASSQLTDISLFAGQLQIEKLVARSVSRSNGADILESHPQIVIEGVTVGGVPAEISSDGVLVNGQPLDEGLVRALGTGIGEFTGGDVRLVDSTTMNQNGRTDGDVVGLFIDVELKASGFPGGTDVFGHLFLGLSSTSARVTADPDPLGDFGFGDFDPGDFGPVALDDGLAGAGARPSPFFGGDVTEVAGETLTRRSGATQAAGPPSAPVVQTRTFPLELLSGVTADRMRLLYGAWSLAVIGFALGSRIRPLRIAPSRRV